MFFIQRSGGWARALEGRVISKYFTNWGSNLLYTQLERGHSFFCRLVDSYLLTNKQSV